MSYYRKNLPGKLAHIPPNFPGALCEGLRWVLHLMKRTLNLNSFRVFCNTQVSFPTGSARLFDRWRQVSAGSVNSRHKMGLFYFFIKKFAAYIAIFRHCPICGEKWRYVAICGDVSRVEMIQKIAPRIGQNFILLAPRIRQNFILLAPHCVTICHVAHRDW